MPSLSDGELMEIQGFWTVVFSAGPNFNGGVVTFKSGIVYGGDNAFFYVGSYQLKDDSVSAQIDCRAFAKNAMNIFGSQADFFSLRIEGQIQQDGSIAAKGTVPAAPHLAINLRMTKRLEV